MTQLDQQIKDLKKAFEQAISKATDKQQLEEVRLQFLSRNGSIANLVEELKKLSGDDKRVFGPLLNALKTEAHALFEQKLAVLERSVLEAARTQEQHFDITAYKPTSRRGSLHPYTHVIREIEDVFTSMGFAVADGPEVETDHYNFTALNIPGDHPARDMHDTFWLDVPGLLMRTHTSNVQVHTLENSKPPIAIIAPGRCYRHEATDASHDFMFMQTEGALVDKNISMAHLLGTAQTFLRALFGKRDLKLRVRPGFFPFVEPGIEIDISCPFCKNGCSVCKRTTWIETAGAGLIHPNVLKNTGIDPNVYSGFAFGFGLTRLTVLKYGINDIRLLHSARLDFLNQF
jgi:phenylalanyl-tRNA synthetase alpha chain